VSKKKMKLLVTNLPPRKWQLTQNNQSKILWVSKEAGTIYTDCIGGKIMLEYTSK